MALQPGLRRTLNRVALVVLLVLGWRCADQLVYDARMIGAVSKGAECRRQLPTLLSQALALDASVPLDFDALSVESTRYSFFLAAEGVSAVAPSGRAPATPTHAVQLRANPDRGATQRVWTPKWPLPSGAVPGRSDAGMTFVCVGDTDGDEGFDVWSIASFPRVVPTGEVPAAWPLHEIADVAPYRSPLERWLSPPPGPETVVLVAH